MCKIDLTSILLLHQAIQWFFKLEPCLGSGQLIDASFWPFFQLNSWIEWIDQQTYLPVDMQFYISVMFLGLSDDIHEEKPSFSQFQKNALRTDRPTNRRTDGQTHLIESWLTTKNALKATLLSACPNLSLDFSHYFFIRKKYKAKAFLSRVE